MPWAVCLRCMQTGETPACAFLDWVHFFIISSHDTSLSVLRGFQLRRQQRTIFQRAPGVQRLRRCLIRRAARKGGISVLLARYQSPGDTEGTVVSSSFLDQPVRLHLPGFRTGFRDRFPQDPELSAEAWQQFCIGRLSAS